MGSDELIRRNLMNNFNDSLATGSTSGHAQLPPRPDLSQTTPIAPIDRTWPSGSFQAAEGWKRAGAILGVVWAFFFLLTIPGWLALSHYKKWKRDEIPTPYGLIWWGYGFSALIVLVVLMSATSPSS